MADLSDARLLNADNSPGIGIGYAPVPADGRKVNEGEPGQEIPPLSSVWSIGDTGLPDEWPEDPSDARGMNADGMPGIGAQGGSPALDYFPVEEAGYDHVENSGLDGGISDPLRRGFTPARRPLTRYLFWRAAWKPEIEGEFARERPLIGEGIRAAQQPRGQMSPMDEYRLLTSGDHA